MTVKNDLTAAKALISDPEKWLKRTFARDGCYCALGAIAHVTGGWGTGGDFGACRAALMASMVPGRRFSSIANLNDDEGTTHADIMALFDRAIEASS